MKKARVTGTGSYLDSKVIDNKELSKRVPDKSDENKNGFDIEKAKETLSVKEGNRKDLFNQWVIKVTEILYRHIYSGEFDDLPDFRGSTEHMGAEAAKKALKMAALKADQIDCVRFCSFTPSYIVPNLAATVGHLIGIDKGYESITVNTACTGFIQELIEANRAIRNGDHKNVLVVASETLSKVTNYNDARTAVLFGDGAGAAVLTADNVGGILGYSVDTDYSPIHITLEESIGYVVMEGGPRVLSKAVRSMKEVGEKALENANLSLEEINCVVPHQANGRMTKSYIEKSGFPKEKVIDIIKYLGNTSAASVAIALDRAIRGEIENIEIERGDKLLLPAVGAGYVLAAAVMEY